MTKLPTPLQVPAKKRVALRQIKPASFVLAVLMSATLPACTTVELRPDGTQQMTAIGIVRVRVPPSTGELTVVERTGLGIGFDRMPGGGGWLGYSDAGWIMADPARCQLIVVVRSTAEVDRLVELLPKMGNGACLVDQSDS